MSFRGTAPNLPRRRARNIHFHDGRRLPFPVPVVRQVMPSTRGPKLAADAMKGDFRILDFTVGVMNTSARGF
jgi:hypothetical protein